MLQKLGCLMALASSIGASNTTPKFWPLPAEVKLGLNDLQISPTVTFEAPDVARLSNAIERYTPLLITTSSSNGYVVDTIKITVTSDSLDLLFSTDSSYSIHYDSAQNETVIAIDAGTIYGAMYALETISQMRVDPAALSNASPAFSIADKPKYNHRAFMADTGRRFIPLSTIKTNIDAMAANKMNVLHLHFADWCRFAIESKLFPELTSGLVGDQGGFYTQDDIKNMITYANDRGIVVMPEVDMPSHSGWAFPLNATGKMEYCPDTGVGPGFMNDADQVSLNTLKAVTLEMAELFNTDLFHIGADETAGNDKVTGCGLEVSERSERALMKTRSMNPRNDHILN